MLSLASSSWRALGEKEKEKKKKKKKKKGAARLKRRGIHIGLEPLGPQLHLLGPLPRKLDHVVQRHLSKTGGAGAAERGSGDVEGKKGPLSAIADCHNWEMQTGKGVYGQVPSWFGT